MPSVYICDSRVKACRLTRGHPGRHNHDAVLRDDNQEICQSSLRYGLKEVSSERGLKREGYSPVSAMTTSMV